MRLKADDAAAISRSNVVTAVGLALVLTVTGILTTTVAAGAILRPIDELTSATARIAVGDLDVTVPVRSADEIGRLAGAFNEMAGRLRAVRESNLGELMVARRLAEAAVDSLYDPVVVTDAAGRVSRLNAAAEPLFGRESEVHGRPLAEVARDPRVSAAVEEVLRSQQSVAGEGAASMLTLPVKGAERNFRLRSTPMREPGGPLLSAVVLLEDISPTCGKWIASSRSSWRPRRTSFARRSPACRWGSTCCSRTRRASPTGSRRCCTPAARKDSDWLG
jgi:NtrC-family two-component system sensor histidine kinase KinB